MDKKGSLTWLWAILIFLALAVLGYASLAFAVLSALNVEIKVIVPICFFVVLILGLIFIKRIYGRTETYKKLHLLLNLFYIIALFHLFLIIWYFLDVWGAVQPFKSALISTLLIGVVSILIIAIKKGLAKKSGN